MAADHTVTPIIEHGAVTLSKQSLGAEDWEVIVVDSGQRRVRSGRRREGTVMEINFGVNTVVLRGQLAVNVTPFYCAN